MSRVKEFYHDQINEGMSDEDWQYQMEQTHKQELSTSILEDSGYERITENVWKNSDKRVYVAPNSWLCMDNDKETIVETIADFVEWENL